MNILIFSIHFHPENFKINEITKKLYDKKHSIRVITGIPNYPNGYAYKGYSPYKFYKENFNGVEILRVPIITRGKRSSVRLIFNYLSFIFISSLYSLFINKNFKIDQILVFGTSPLIQGLAAIPIKIIKRAKLNLWVLDLWPDDLINTGYIKNKFILNINKLIVKILYKFCNKILIQSKAFKKEINKYDIFKNIYYLPNPTEFDDNIQNYFKKNYLNQDLRNTLENFFTITYAGNVGNNQSLQTLIEVAKKLVKISKIKILIVGDGSNFEEIKNKVKKENIANVILLGRFEKNKIKQVMIKSSILYLSLKNRGSLPLTVPGKLQDYMTMGRPILGSIAGEAAKIISDSKCGFSVEPENPLILYDKILEISALDKKELEKLGSNGKKYALKNFNLDKISNSLIEIMNK